MIKTIIFDLDGTLLPMDQDEFLAHYFHKIAEKFSNVDPKLVVHSIQTGVKAMFKNNGEKTNETVFWDAFIKTFPVSDHTVDAFENFYQQEFQTLQELTPNDPLVPLIIHHLKSKGYRLICCTNPVFPRIATESRIRWTGLEPEDFIHITTYEDSHYCKPNLKYYQEVLTRFSLNATECMMIGNDVGEDMCTKAMGMKTYLVSNHIINRSNGPENADHMGSREDLYQFVLTFPSCL
ncbi:MAG: HAD family hydrolase [Bacilli bacterium]